MHRALFAPNGNHIIGVKARMTSYVEIDKNGEPTDRFVMAGEDNIRILRDGHYPKYVDVQGESWSAEEVLEDPTRAEVSRLEDGDVVETEVVDVEEVLDGVHDDRQLLIDHAASYMGLDGPEETDKYNWTVSLE